MPSPNAITFPFTVAKVQTLADGAPRITIDLPESCIPEMGMLAQSKLDGIYLQATITVASLTELDDETKKEPKGSGAKVDRRRLAIRRD